MSMKFKSTPYPSKPTTMSFGLKRSPTDQMEVEDKSVKRTKTTGTLTSYSQLATSTSSIKIGNVKLAYESVCNQVKESSDLCSCEIAWQEKFLGLLRLDMRRFRESGLLVKQILAIDSRLTVQGSWPSFILPNGFHCVIVPLPSLSQDRKFSLSPTLIVGIDRLAELGLTEHKETCHLFCDMGEGVSGLAGAMSVTSTLGFRQMINWSERSGAKGLIDKYRFVHYDEMRDYPLELDKGAMFSSGLPCDTLVGVIVYRNVFNSV